MTICTRFGNECKLIGSVDDKGFCVVEVDYKDGKEPAVKGVYLSDLKADGGLDEIMAASDALKVQPEVDGVSADVAEHAELIEKYAQIAIAEGHILPQTINAMLTDAMICIPSDTFHRDELRVKVYELFKYPLSAKQTRDSLYRLRVSGWGITHLGLGKYSVGV